MASCTATPPADIEARLRQDKAVRAEAESLKQAWDLLDCLPRPEPPVNFTHRTMERLAPISAGYAPPVSLAALAAPCPRRRLGRGPGAGLPCRLLRLSPVFDLGRARRQRTGARLRLIENKRLYEVGDSIDFLRKLDHPDLFGDDSGS